MSDDLVRLIGPNATEEKEHFLFVHNTHAKRLAQMSIPEKYELKLRLQKAIRHMRMLEFSTEIILREDMREMDEKTKAEIREKDKLYKPRLAVSNETPKPAKIGKTEQIKALMATGFSKEQASLYLDLVKMGFSDENARATVFKKKEA